MGGIVLKVRTIGSSALSAIGIGLAVMLSVGFDGKGMGDMRSAQPAAETVTDCDGNVYRTVAIGAQIWMAENLRVSHYRDGTPILHVQDNERWPLAIGGAYCVGESDTSAYKDTYGLLYNHYAVTSGCELCPDGWHVPTRAECLELIRYLGGSNAAGAMIRDNRAGLWTSGKGRATNESGFCGLPAGGRGRFGPPGEVGHYATWWSSTSTDSLFAWHWGLFPDKDGIRSNPGHKASGFSVRCIKD